MPSVRSCDPAAYGQNFNLTLLITQGVSIEVRWTWDGVSVYPGCDGPLVNGTGSEGNWAVRAVNNSAVPYYAHTVHRYSGQPLTWVLNPEQTATVTAAQAAINGYTLYSDFYDLILDSTA